MIAQIKDQEKKKLNIAIVQIYNDAMKNYAEYSRLLNVMYAKQHNYAYISFEYNLVPLYISIHYNKIKAIESVFKDSQNFDWVLYIDEDAAVSNFDYKIEDIIDRHEEKEIIIAQDNNGVNNGVFLIKNTDKMKEFLQKTYEDKTFFHEKTPDQRSMFHYLLTEYKDLVGTEPAHFLNAYIKGYSDFSSAEDIKYWDKDSFIIHLFKLSTEDRINIFKQILLSSRITCVSKPKEIDVFNFTQKNKANKSNKISDKGVL
jgi:hypothetical protein